MDYEQLRFKPEYVGKRITHGARVFTLHADMDAKAKAYIYNMVTKQVFDIFTNTVEVSMSAPVTDKEIEVIEVKDHVEFSKEAVEKIEEDFVSGGINLDDYTLAQLRVMFPEVKANTRAKFIAKL